MDAPAPPRAHGLLISARTARRHYLVRGDHVERPGLLPLSPPAIDSRGQPTIYHELGPLLDPDDCGESRHTLTVSLRRRSVVLLVARLDDLADAATLNIQPLSPLITRRLEHPWYLGVAIIDDTPILVLDLRRIAADLALGIIGAHA